MVRSGKYMTVNVLRQLCDSHGSNGPPGARFRTKAFESAFSGCRPRGPVPALPLIAQWLLGLGLLGGGARHLYRRRQG